MNGLTYSQKKYLFAIYKLGQNGEEVKSSEVARFVGVRKASTASMAVKLSESGYIKKELYGQIGCSSDFIESCGKPNSTFDSRNYVNTAIPTVPASIAQSPNTAFLDSRSPKKIPENTMDTRILSLSIGTTTLTAPF